MLERAWAAGLEPAWVLGDEVYSDFRTRWLLEARGQPYVLAVSSNQRVWSGGYQVPVAELADACLEPDWWLWRVADGAKGPRQYEWAAGRIGSSMDERLVGWLLVRRSCQDPSERAYYLCAASPETAAQQLATAAGQRWPIESCFETAKQETGLDEYEVRTWHGWYRHITLSMLALAFLAAVRAQANETRVEGGLLVPLTEPEVRRLLLAIVLPRLQSSEEALLWSHWRRHHQAVARHFDTPQPKGVGILASTGESRKHGTESRHFPRSLYPQRAFFGTARPYLEVTRSQSFLKEGALDP